MPKTIERCNTVEVVCLHRAIIPRPQQARTLNFGFAKTVDRENY